MYTIEQAVASVQNAPGSMYTREDVISLLHRIEVTESVTKICPLTDFQIQSLTEKVISAIRENAESLDSDCIDKDSAELSFGHGREVDLDSVGFDTDVVAREVINGVDDVIVEWFERAFPNNNMEDDGESDDDDE
jgi:hypothetical protein